MQTTEQKQTAHTPGPWRVTGGMADGYNIIGADNTVLASNLWPSDARLIAAAPDLLKAAQQTLVQLEHTIHTHSLGDSLYGACDRLKAAIAKATEGNQP